MRRIDRGFSLIELMVVIALLAIIIGLAAPSFVDFFDRSRLRGAADAVAALIGNARQEAVRNGRDITLQTTGTGETWCIGANQAVQPAAGNPVGASAACACTAPSSCLVNGEQRVAASSAFNGVTLDEGLAAAVVIDGKYGSVNGLGVGRLTLVSPSGDYELQVDISPLGRASVCNPGTRTIAGYPSC